jgi:hypothetical protein
MYTKPEATFAGITQIFYALNQVQGQANVDSIPGVQFKGSMSQGDTPRQQVAVVIEKGEKIYKFQLNYNSETVNKAIEDEFFRVLNSVRLT